MLCVVLCSGCASSPMIQPQINSLVIGERFDLALKTMDAQQDVYGSRNELLYYLDLGLVSHYAQEYRKSIDAFEKAKRIYDRNYTISISNAASTWVVNDNRAPYRGEDFERALINVFQALNFVALSDMDGALVEARDVDARLRLINQQYSESARNVYREDAFVRMLMGLIYEASGTREGLNDAFISYQKAWEIYQSDYLKNYQLDVPTLLKTQWIRVARELGWKEDLPKELLKEWNRVSDISRAEARIIVVHYQGLSPIKHQVSIPVPLPNGNVARLAFPKFNARFYPQKDFVIRAVNETVIVQEAQTQLVENISRIAQQDFDKKQLQMIAKAVARQAGKQVAIDSMERLAEDKSGKTTGKIVKVAGNLYAWFSEQPDLRSWQTLPAEIRLAVLDVPAGIYTIKGNDHVIRDNLIINEGDAVFIPWRSSR